MLTDVQSIENKLSRRPHSPLFVRLASEYLASGEVEKALELCSSGIHYYPQYGTAYLVRAKCFAAKHDYLSALLDLKHVVNVFQDSTLLQKYELEWKDLAVKQEMAGSIAHEEPVVEVPEPVHVEENNIAVPDPVLTVEDKTQIEINELPVVDQVQVPAEVVPSSHEVVPAVPDIPEIIPIRVHEQKPVPDTGAQERMTASPKVIIEGERIISKTLAEIYAKQGEFEEAIITYRLLQQQRPKQAEEFALRIKELEEKKQAKQDK